MDPVSLFSVATAGSKVAGGLAGSARANDEARRLDAEARLADTQALQRDTQLRDELTRFLSSTQSARAANGLSIRSPNANKLMFEATEELSDERRRTVADYRQRAANLRAGAKSARRRARVSLVTGAFSAAPALNDLL